MSSEFSFETERPASPTMRELADNVQKQLDFYKSSKSPPRSSTIATAPEPADFISRTAAGPVAAVAISPAYPDYMTIGTYALLKPDEPEASVGQIRNGSIYVLPVNNNFKPAYPGNMPPLLDSKCLSAAVLDIHFHPSEDSLLGVAMSNASMSFFRLVKHADVHARRIEMRLIYLGSIVIAESDEHGAKPLITAFTWLPGITTTSVPGSSGYHTVYFAATDTDGGVRLIEATVLANRSLDAPNLISAHSEPEMMKCVDLHEHTQEAWTAAVVTLSKSECCQGEVRKILILSGGDDSALIATLATLKSTSDTANTGSLSRPQSSGSGKPSSGHPSGTSTPSSVADWPPTPQFAASYPIENSPYPLLLSPPLHLWTDRKTHDAGVVAILPLSKQKTTVPLLTGSYDETLRLFALETTSLETTTPILKKRLLIEKKLGGGVWRLNLMDETTSSDGTYAALILASCMHTGGRILRVSHTPNNSIEHEAKACDWTIDVLHKFTKGHESMNYASDFRSDKEGEYTIVTTSFYDKQVCVWKFAA